MSKLQSMTAHVRVALALGFVMACGGETKVDTQATGIELSVERPDTLALDQLRVRIDNAAGTIFGPVFVPQTPRTLEVTESLVVLVGPERQGETLTVTVAGYLNGGGVADGATTATITAHALTQAMVLLQAPPPSACGDGQCSGSENLCSCPADCVRQCGDGCCSPPEKNSNCPADCP